MLFSIVIPTLNEAGTLEYALKQLLASIDYLSEVEIIVSDGGSQDDTLQQARQFPVQVVNAPAGRALQMNAGADQAIGDWLIFLHADTRLPAGWMQHIQLSQSDWGRFDVRLSGSHWLFRIIERGINLRSRKTAVATGDQAMFFRRDFFHQIGGFPQIPLMEDIAICKAARQRVKPDSLRQAVVTSSRRWEQNGILRTVLTMWTLRFAYWAGIKPDRLHRLYYPKS